MEKINVVITDDHRLFRKGIHSIVKDFEFVNEIYEAENGLELIKLLHDLEVKPDVVLLDIKMPVMDGIEATQKIKEQFPDVKILILTMEDDEQIILYMINKGVNGYLLKNADPDELELALSQLIEKEFYFPSDISNLVLRNIHNGSRKEISLNPELSEREIQVLELICKENTAQEIAEVLSISKRTVEGHKKRLLEKTETKNMAGLVVFAFKNKIVHI
ncbi:response regulator transcription factor [Maribellus maritimus]|uniref:response regulator transcription factor n=1 Tax=Maribellus maritimus TaxID=2870838 RepID=UPI001EEC899F|nr:response regulator transcription factor [Maribellus maritimus]MCG6187018.1 response regulator transcription factor [Maribellus maritimus]